MTKTLGATQIRLNLVDLIQQASDPSSAGGVAAAIGSFYLRSGIGQAWLKTAAGDTGWTKLVQSFAWYSVKDYGAKGDNATDDTAACQAAINACATAGGGVVFFPYGTYRVSQLTINAQNNVQLQGSGASSVIRWTWNAATAAGSMVTVTGASRGKFDGIVFDGSGLTNPNAGRDNHLLKFVGPVVEDQVFRCKFTGMVAGSGDGVHIVGTAGNLVSRLWVSMNTFDGCSRFGVGGEQGYEFVWVTENYMTNCETEVAFVATADLNGTSLLVQANEINHTGTVRHALRFEGGATTFITRLLVAANIVIGGFATLNRVQSFVWDGVIQTSGAYASADAVLRIFGNVSQGIICGGVIDRDPAASAGPVIKLEKATNAPNYIRIAQAALINETTAVPIIQTVDCSNLSLGGNICHGTDTGASTAYAFDIQAVTAAVTNILVGVGNRFTGNSSWAAGVRLLANGANMTDVSVVGNQGSQLDYGVQFEVGGGGGAFDGQIMYAGNNFVEAVGDFNNVGVTVRPRIGLNAGLGAQLIRGPGSPESVVTAAVGSIYSRSDGAQASVVYYKETGTGNTGWLGIGGSVLLYGSGDVRTVSTSVFLAPGWIDTSTVTEYQIAVTRPGTIRNFYIQVATAGVTSTTNTYTVRKNGVATALTVAIDNTATGQVSDVTHSVTVAAGDLLSVNVTKGGVVGTGQAGVVGSMELV